MSRVKICTVADVPAELAHAWMQHLRDFDTAHAGCHFQVMADAPDLKLAEIVDILRVHPALSFQEIIERARTK